MSVLRDLNSEVLAPLDRGTWCFCRADRGAARAIKVHSRHPYLLHLDLKAFFPSTSTHRVRQGLIQYRFSAQDAEQIARVCTIANELPQGAPTSVTLGNLVLRKVDSRIGNLCVQHGLTYTRYVDDLAISGGSRVERIAPRIKQILEEEGWCYGTKGGLMPPEVPHAYLGAIVNGFPRPSNAQMRNLASLSLMLQSGDHTVLPQLLGLCSWYKSMNPIAGELLLAAVKYCSEGTKRV